MQKNKHDQFEYFFGFGADAADGMIEMVLKRPIEAEFQAVLRGYELYIQPLNNITTQGQNPREILRAAWGDDFQSYGIAPKLFGRVHGSVYKVTHKERCEIDRWELVPEGWQLSKRVTVRLPGGRRLKAYTQVLAPGQSPGEPVKQSVYEKWLFPQQRFEQVMARSFHSHSS